MHEKFLPWYPDVVQAGSLASALEGLARDHDLDIGDPRPGLYDPDTAAEISTARGLVDVEMRDGIRAFFVNISTRTHTWAAGTTDNLSEVARVVAAWRGGCTLCHLRDVFSFMSYTELAKAFEGGYQVEFRWSYLAEEYRACLIEPLLLAVRADVRLSKLYPSVTHNTILRLFRKDSGGDSEVLIECRSDLQYEVSLVQTGEQRLVESLEATVRTASELIPAVNSG